MTVREMMEKLGELDPDLEVFLEQEKDILYTPETFTHFNDRVLEGYILQ